MSRRTLLKMIGSGLACLSFPVKSKASMMYLPPEQQWVLQNDHIHARWKTVGKHFLPDLASDLRYSKPLALSVLCQVELADGTIFSSNEMMINAPIEQKEGLLRVSLENEHVLINWEAVLLPDAHYLKQSVTLTSIGKPLFVKAVILHDEMDAGVRTTGSVRGCPLVTDTAFYAFEHPLSEHEVQGNRVKAYLSRSLPLQPKKPVRYSSVIGVAKSGQLRRDFARYVEAERAHPYRPFLHYNGWYDLSFSDIRYSAAQAVERIKAFGQKLLAERKIALKSYLMDDGWDDPKTLWGFNEGFPNGFAEVSAAAKEQGAAPGVWMSPWGGYGNEKIERLKYGVSQGFETNKDGFALSGPNYFARFRDTTLRMIRGYGVNQFKLDGMGDINHVTEGGEFDSDFDAAIQLIKDIRAENNDIYINLTYGTFPSPFWLWYADSIWRGGKDHDHIGAGSKRQQWITYRDGDTYENIVQKSELFPLNSLMLHGIIFAQHTPHLKEDAFGDFDDEVRSFFASGTQCQELYITPDLLKEHHWDQLAQGAEFAKKHAAILQDAHWVGGNPKAGNIYGWAAWSPDQSFITLRNPAAQEQSFELNLQDALELPQQAVVQYAVRSVWEMNAQGWSMHSSVPQVITLKPFALMTLQITPSLAA